jgi:hypothetical protein
MTTAEKRSVHTDALATLGTILNLKDGPARDAIHLAVEPVRAGERLKPNDDIGIKGGLAFKARDGVPKRGKADPFITADIMPGDVIWLVIYPRQIKSLRHVWEHPAFPTETVIADLPDPKAATAKAVIEQQADDMGITYGDIMSYAEDYVRYGSYAVDGGRWEGMGIDGEKFWESWAILNPGRDVPEHKASFFSCSC